VNSSQLDTISVKTSDNVTLGYTVAGLGSRLVAQIIDNLVAVPLVFAGLLLYGALADDFVTSSQGATFAGAGAGFFAFFTYFGYFFISEAVTGGKTPGKSAMGLKVIKVDGSAADFGAIAVRNVIRVVDVAVFLVGIVVGGLASVSGAIYGALFIQFVPNLANDISDAAPWAIYGLAMLAFMYAMPNGVVGSLKPLIARAGKYVAAR